MTETPDNPSLAQTDQPMNNEPTGKLDSEGVENPPPGVTVDPRRLYMEQLLGDIESIPDDALNAAQVSLDMLVDSLSRMGLTIRQTHLTVGVAIGRYAMDRFGDDTEAGMMAAGDMVLPAHLILQQAKKKREAKG